VLAIDLLDRSSSDKSVKRVSFYSGDGFVVRACPLASIVSPKTSTRSSCWNPSWPPARPCH
jgi:hypothetical protein